LHSDALAVNDPNILITAAMGLVKILFHNGLYLTWWNGVEINNVGNRQVNGLSVGILVVAEGWFRIFSGTPATPKPADECEQFHRSDVIR
jgi:hypothetical protein